MRKKNKDERKIKIKKKRERRKTDTFKETSLQIRTASKNVAS